jgi:hypothetical protein
MIAINILIGSTGMLVILIAFILDEFYEKFNQNTVQYNALNVIGAVLLIYYAYTLNSWPFIILNAVWMAVAVIKLIRILK